MSVINTERDLQSLLVDMQGEMSQADLEKIAEALPSAVLIAAAVRRAQPGSDYKISAETALSDGEKFGILVRVYLAWIKVPAFRLAQILAHIIADRLPRYLFFSRDETVAADIESFVQEYTAPKE